MPLGDTRRVEQAEYVLMDAVEDRMWWYRAMHSRVLGALEGLPPRARVLDAGCGTGGFLARLRTARPDLRLLGVEFAGEAARRAARKSGATVAAGSVNALPLRDGAVDAVVSLDVLCHAAAEPPAALREFRRYERSSAAAMLRDAGFAAPEARHWNSLLLPLMVVQRKLLARGDEAASDVAEYPAWLDRSLHAVTRVEAALLRAGLRFPAGGSLIATATRG